jgi:fumarate hydratase subunit alpha
MYMRVLDTKELIAVIAGLCQKASYELGDDVLDGYKKALASEDSPLGKEVIEMLLENAAYAKEKRIPCCQDTGVCVVYMRIGQQVSWEGMPLVDAINQGVREGYLSGYLRISVIKDPIHRVNTNDNTPAVIHTEIVEGDKVEITVFPKGFGSENQNQLKMLTPAQGIEGFLNYVVDVVKQGAAKSCPPLVVGVGLGGTTEKAAILSKLALRRRIGQRSEDPDIAALEEELLKRINNSGIGPLGLGGRNTALDVFIEKFATHIAGFPVAVNMQCHANRHATAVL